MFHTMNGEKKSEPANDQLTIGSGFLSIRAWLQPQDHVSSSSHLVLLTLI